MKSAALPQIALLAIASLVTTFACAKNAQAQIPWQNNLRTAHAQAQAEGKLLLLHFYSDNCPWCDKLDAGAFQDPAVAAAISGTYVPVKIHANSNPKLAEMFKVERFPSDVVVTIEGRTLAHSVSPQQSEKYIAMLRKAVPSDLPTGTPAVNPTPTMVAAARTTPTPTPTAAAVSPPAPPAPTDAKVQLASSRQAGMTMPSASPAVAPEKMTASKSKPQPASQPELAMDGFCCISVVDEARWIEGSPDFGVIHLGKLYLFADEVKMKKFLADPIPYTPVLNEIDVVRFFEERVIVPGKREWAMQDPDTKRIFFFADEASMLHFENTHERYVGAAIAVMAQAVNESNPR